MHSLNLGILAHVDAGKTTLTERLLYAAGVIDEIGSVDRGNTQTDTLELERERGITIKSAVVSFVIGTVTVNLIDTPGHPDFIAEVERVLSVLDGVVLVISAVEGVQAQTRVLMRTLQRLRIPTLIFVNKIDRGGARDDGVLREIAEKLTPAIVQMGAGSDLGSRAASVREYGASDDVFTDALVAVLAEQDDELLEAYVRDGSTVPYPKLRQKLAVQTRRAQVHPVFFGSAITGAGVDALTKGIEELLPSAEGDVGACASGTVFKVERGPAGEKIAYVRMFSGEVRTRDVLRFGRDDVAKVTAIHVFDHGAALQRSCVAAGQIGKLWGLGDVQIGDVIGTSSKLSEHHFAPPSLEAVVVPTVASEKGALYAALTQLAEQDPLINLRQDDIRQELFVSLYGEVQKEVIQATLKSDFDIDVGFRETSTICIERPIGTGETLEILRRRRNPFLATVGLRIDPAAVDSGVEFRLDIDIKSIPLYVYKTVEEFGDSIEDTVLKTLRQGLYGWNVTDCTVTLTHSGYSSPGSKSGDFRKLTPLVLMSALKKARTAVCEPINRFHLEVPSDTLGVILPALTRSGATPDAPAARGSSAVLTGEIPAARVYELQQQLSSLTRGEGVLECTFDRYEPVRGLIPSRPRSDNNPLNRKEYLLHVLRRV